MNILWTSYKDSVKIFSRSRDDVMKISSRSLKDLIKVLWRSCKDLVTILKWSDNMNRYGFENLHRFSLNLQYHLQSWNLRLLGCIYNRLRVLSKRSRPTLIPVPEHLVCVDTKWHADHIIAEPLLLIWPLTFTTPLLSPLSSTQRWKDGYR